MNVSGELIRTGGGDSLYQQASGARPCSAKARPLRQVKIVAFPARVAFPFQKTTGRVLSVSVFLLAEKQVLGSSSVVCVAGWDVCLLYSRCCV